MNKKLTMFVVLPLSLSVIAFIFGALFISMQNRERKKESVIMYIPDDTTRMRMYFDSLKNVESNEYVESNDVAQKIYEFATGFRYYGGVEGRYVGMINYRSFETEKDTLVDSIAYEKVDSLDYSKKYLVFNYLGLNLYDHHSRYPKFIYYTQNNSSYVSKLQEDSVLKTDTSFLRRYGKTGVKLFRYSHLKKVDYLFLPSHPDDSKEGIGVPIKNKFSFVISYILVYFLCILEFYIIAFIVVNTLALFFNISRNRVFDSFNILVLKWMAIGCFFSLLFPYLFTLIFYLIYFKDFYPNVSFTHSFWKSDYIWCIVGIVYLLLFLAFRKGYKLQQEQDLTI